MTLYKQPRMLCKSKVDPTIIKNVHDTILPTLSKIHESFIIRSTAQNSFACSRNAAPNPQTRRKKRHGL